MLCTFTKCDSFAEAICKTCPKTKNLFCKDHAWCHTDESDHKFKSLSKKKFNNYLRIWVKSEIKIYRRRITQNAQKIISSVIEISTNAIKHLEEINKDIKSISEFRPFQFDNKKVSFLLQQINLLNEEPSIQNKDERPQVSNIPPIEKNKEYTRVQLDTSAQPIISKNERIQENIIHKEHQKDQTLEVNRNQPKIDERKYEKEIIPLNQPKTNQTDQGNTWNCSCGIKNQNNTQMCIRCRKPRENQSINTWTCKKCKIINNDQNSYSCSKCCFVDAERKEFISKNVIKPTTKIADPEQKTAEKKVNPPQKEVIVEIWECKCGQSNMPDYNICIKCENLKPGLKGWVCKKCKFLNEEPSNQRSNNCKLCGNQSQNYFQYSYNYNLPNFSMFDERFRYHGTIYTSSDSSEEETFNKSYYRDSEEWMCKKCNISMGNNKLRCSLCKEFKSVVMKTYSGLEGYSQRKNCRLCKKEIKTVICRCKNQVLLSAKKCKMCKADITEINVCSNCSEKKFKALSYRGKK